VHDSAAHKPEALAKGHGILRLRLRLVCRGDVPVDPTLLC